MKIVYDGVHKTNPNGIRITKFDNTFVLSTVNAKFEPWYGEYETALWKNGSWHILEGYSNLEDARKGHEKFMDMSEKELDEYDYIG